MTMRHVGSLALDHLPIPAGRWVEIISPTVEGPFHIEPADISQGALCSSFDNSETEASASWVLRLCRERGGWVAFTEDEIQAVYATKYPDSRFQFNWLVEHGVSYGIRGDTKRGGGWIVLGADGKYRVTVNFILRCFESRLKSEVRDRKAGQEPAAGAEVPASGA